MNISTSKHKKSTKKTKKGKLTPEQRFQREWERVQAMQKQNKRLKAEVEDFAQGAIAVIAEVEEAYAEAQFDLAEHLLGFTEKKTLSQGQREELFSWIDEVLHRLVSSPFAKDLDVSSLYHSLRTLVDQYLLKQAEDAGLSIDEGLDVDDEEEMDAALDDLFREYLGAEGFDSEGEDFFDDDPFTEHSRQREESLNQLLKSSSINKMFRQIASAIHPDREVDAELKVQRNQWMAELAQARDDKDVPKIFAMYSEHVGASPLEFIGEDVEKVITLLKRQTERLRSEQQSIIYANPLHGSLYEAFYHKSNGKIAQALQRHVVDIEQRLHAYRQMTGDITNLKTLKVWLKGRAAFAREMALEGDIPF